MISLFNTILAQGFQLPPGNPWVISPTCPAGPGTCVRIFEDILEPVANFLIAAGIVLAIIALVVSGIMYFRTPSEAQAKLAWSWFRNGLIGALIILAVGVIINTIALIVTGGFFNFLPGP